MGISEEVFAAGQRVINADDAISTALNEAIGGILGWPYKVASARVRDSSGTRSDFFSSVVYTAQDPSNSFGVDGIPADNTAAVIDAMDSMDLASLRAGYARIARVKRLKKAPAPYLSERPITTVTLGVLFARRSNLPLERLAQELELLNATTPDREWTDMIVVGSVGAVQYGVQFPGEDSAPGAFLPPAEGAFVNRAPPLYIIMMMSAAGEYSFNKMISFLVGHLAIFSPGAALPSFAEVLKNVPKTAIVISGYQYNLHGALSAVPRDHYKDRYFPHPPIRIEGQNGDLLAEVKYLPWQDGGVITLRGQFPLEALLAMQLKDAAGVRIIRRPDNLQISYVLPLTEAQFHDLLRRFQQRSNMRVRRSEDRFVIQKWADEGSGSPFMARIFLGLMRMRDLVYSEAERIEKFDEHFDLVITPLFAARTAAKEMTDIWDEHFRKVAAGEVARQKGPVLQIDESIDRELKRAFESFLNSAVRSLKQGMQQLAPELGVDIGFLFQQNDAFERGIEALRQNDPVLAEYLRHTRTWSEPLLETRNAVEHKGWTLPRVTYRQMGSSVSANEPEVVNKPATWFVNFTLDRLCCFVEEFTVHGLQKRMPPQVGITEITPVARRSEAPERFSVTIAIGGLPLWQLAYHDSRFDET